MATGGGGGGGGCEFIGFLYCFVSLFVFGLIGWKNYSNLPDQIKIAKAWAHPPNGAKWVMGKCKVHSAGISNQGGCWHPAPMQEASWFQWGKINRNPDLPAEFSVCPGLRWCADEGGSCNDCNGGEVLYAAALFHGNQPYEVKEGQAGPEWISGEIVGDAVREILLNSKVPSGNNFTVRNVNGPVQCGHGDGKPFKVDPAPGRKKYCYCTPKAITDVVKQKGPIHPSGQYCPAVTNQAFMSETKARRLGQFVSPEALNSTTQQWMFPEGYCRPEDNKNSLVNDFYQFNSQYDVFLNWALVEVSGTDLEGFNDASSKPVLRCAYTFGAPFASREDTYEIKTLYQKWNSSINQGTLDCYVREGGACGKGACAVAMKNPAELYENPPGFGPFLPIFWMLLGCCPYILCFCVMITVIINAGKQSQQQQQGVTQQAQPLTSPTA